MNNKWIALIVLTLFIVSIVPVAAKQEAQRVGETTPAVRAMEGQTLRSGELVQERVMQKDRLQAARQDFAQAKERLTQAREKYQTRKQSLAQTKSQLQQCKDEGKSREECDVVRKQLKGDAAGVLQHSAEMMLDYLNKLKARVEASEDITDEEAAAAIADIDEKIAGVEDILSRLDTFGEEITQQQVKEFARELRQIQKGLELKAKKHTVRLMYAKMHGIIVRSEQLEAKLERILERAEAAGKDTAAAESLMTDFSAKLDSARSTYEELRALLDSTESEAIMREAVALSQSMHKNLQDAHRILMQIFKELKDNNVAVGDNTEDGAEEEEEEEIDDDASDVDEADEEETEDESDAEDTDESGEDADDDESEDESSDDSDESSDESSE